MAIASRAYALSSTLLFAGVTAVSTSVMGGPPVRSGANDAPGASITSAAVSLSSYPGGGLLSKYDGFNMALPRGYSIRAGSAALYSIQGAQDLTPEFSLDNAALVDDTGNEQPTYFGDAKIIVGVAGKPVVIKARSLITSKSSLLNKFGGKEIVRLLPQAAANDGITITCQGGHIYINDSATSFTSMCGPFREIECTGGSGMKVTIFKYMHTCG